MTEYRESVDQALAEIFRDYEETAGLRDLKDEIAANLCESIQGMTAKGASGETALRQALDRLGDITEVADRMSRQKRQEIIGGAFARPVPLDRLHIAAYPLAGLVLAFGVTIFGIVYFSAGLMPAIASLMPFAVVSLCAFVFFALTQETRSRHPMTWKRGLLYAAALALILCGLFTGAIALLAPGTPAPEEIAARAEFPDAALAFENIGIISALGSLIPFALPGGAMLALLVLGEKDRKKPWARRMEEEQSQTYGARFGLVAGAVWIFAAALFCVLTALVGIRYSWITFIAAAAVQLLVMSGFAKKR
ncbi:MAG: permease prefix domain 1-containing protein [Treponema sp.]|jgi:hypothetical protein|nr:permease prefix domain 1-containing protein [Treponema sp.]